MNESIKILPRPDLQAGGNGIKVADKVMSPDALALIKAGLGALITGLAEPGTPMNGIFTSGVTPKDFVPFPGLEIGNALGSTLSGVTPAGFAAPTNLPALAEAIGQLLSTSGVAPFGFTAPAIMPLSEGWAVAANPWNAVASLLIGPGDPTTVLSGVAPEGFVAPILVGVSSEAAIVVPPLGM